MTSTKASPRSAKAVQAMLDPQVVTGLLREIIVWPGAARPEKLVVHRCWPTTTDGFSFEWSFELGGAAQQRLFGVLPAPACSADAPDRCEATMRSRGIENVLVRDPRSCLLVHSPDRDPRFPRLAECLDERAMARRLAPVWGRIDRDVSSPVRAVRCSWLAYRAGRRGTLAYRAGGTGRPWQCIVGKAYRDGRAERLFRLHEEVGEQLAHRSNGRVRVPRLLSHLPDVGMIVCDWAGGEAPAPGSPWSPRRAEIAVDVLAALHRLSIDNLPRFGPMDECGVVGRWHRALACALPSVACETRPLVDDLLRAGETVGITESRTIHRDFYGQQLSFGRRTTTLLDLDTVAVGDPCVDLGNLFAHVCLDMLTASRDAAAPGTFCNSLTQAYERRAGPVDRAALAFYWASALFRVGAVHAFRTRTCRHAAAMWRLARGVPSETDTLAGGGRRLPRSRSTGQSGMDGGGDRSDPETTSNRAPSVASGTARSGGATAGKELP